MFPSRIDRRSALQIAMFGTILVLLGWIATFKVIDYDVWWHIASGRLMRATGWLITTEPFAFTRVGQPYLATHEWLAQLILSVVFDVGGALGLIGMRVLFTLFAFGVLIAVDWRRAWIYGLLAIPLALSIRGTLLDRPQLWSFALFSLVFFLCVRFLQNREPSTRERRAFALRLFAVTVLWSNLHGGAALLGLGLAFAAYCQRIFDPLSWKGKTFGDPTLRPDRIWGPLTLLFGACGLFLTPHPTAVFDYLGQLLSDQTIVFIQEWSVRPFGEYLGLFWLPWIAAVAAAGWSRRFPIFSLLALVIFGGLSLSARRHETFFVLASFGVIVTELAGNPRWHDWLLAVERRERLWAGAFAVAVVIGAAFIVRDTAFFAGRNGWTGIGTVEPLKGAVDFLEQRHIDGRAFNTYEAGGYLLYRGRKVFVDGRNVDYGYSFLSNTFHAGDNVATWRSIVDQYGIDVAIIHYAPYMQTSPMPYVPILDADGQWMPVYLDDDAAVYLRATDNVDTINALGYRALSASLLVDPFFVTSADPTVVPLIESEARRAIAAAPSASMRARIVLAYTLAMQNKGDDSLAALDEASTIQPYRYEPLEARGVILAERGDWKNALDALRRAIDLAGGEGHMSLQYGTLATIAEKAGDADAAAEYRRKAESQ